MEELIRVIRSRQVTGTNRQKQIKTLDVDWFVL